MSYACAVCHTTKKLNICSACKAVHYCGAEHQKADWKKHKVLCNKAKEAAKTGFVKDITTEGNGPMAKGTVTVHYTGTLLDGTKFDSSRDRDDPFSFRLGAREVIKGWDEGVATMKVGERATFVLSPSYGYGVHGAPPDIPPNAPLVFDVEVLSCK